MSREKQGRRGSQWRTQQAGAYAPRRLVLYPNVELGAGISHEEIDVHQAVLRGDEVDLEDARSQAGCCSGKSGREYGRGVGVVSEPLDMNRHGWGGELGCIRLAILAGRVGLAAPARYNIITEPACAGLDAELAGRCGTDAPANEAGALLARESALAYNGTMEQVSQPKSLAQDEGSDLKRPLVFLDTNVIIGYLQGDQSAAQLFSAEAYGRIRFAVNAIVLQELLLAADTAGRPEFERIRDHLRVLPVDFAKAEALLPRVRALRNRLVHSNDILIVSSADACDFLVTRDVLLKNLVTADKPQVVTPEELVTHLRAA